MVSILIIIVLNFFMSMWFLNYNYFSSSLFVLVSLFVNIILFALVLFFYIKKFSKDSINQLKELVNLSEDPLIILKENKIKIANAEFYKLLNIKEDEVNLDKIFDNYFQY